MDKDSRKRHLVVDDDFRYRSTGAVPVPFLKPTWGDIPEKRSPGVYLVGSECDSLMDYVHKTGHLSNIY